MFERKKSIIPPYMTEEEFLSVLRAITVHRRLNAPQKSGYTADAFSRAFARNGHPDGGPAFIKTNDLQSGPIQEACRFLIGKSFKPREWLRAANAIGLPDELAKAIQKACDLHQDRNIALYRRLLDACGLPHNRGRGLRPATSSDEDEEDIKAIT